MKLDTPGTTILDSSLITQYRSSHPTKNYSVKLINCGDYIQVYFFENTKEKNNTLYEKDILKKIDTDTLVKKNKPMLTDIALKNIIRSKLQCERLAKSNIKEWGTFITLTFKDNVTDIKQANKQFNTWRTNIAKLKKEFKYIAVPEFQKRGAVHYHILSNLTMEDTDIIVPQKSNNKYYDIKYWSYGYSAVDDVKGDIRKIIGYISKYMTKDYDSRLYGHRRYLNSVNLNKPGISYIDLDDQTDLAYLNKLIEGKDIDYQTTYIDTYTGHDISYLEYRFT